MFLPFRSLLLNLQIINQYKMLMVVHCNKSSDVTTTLGAEMPKTLDIMQLYIADMPTAFSYAHPTLPPDQIKTAELRMQN